MYLCSLYIIGSAVEDGLSNTSLSADSSWCLEQKQKKKGTNNYLLVFGHQKVTRDQQYPLPLIIAGHDF